MDDKIQEYNEIIYNLNKNDALEYIFAEFYNNLNNKEITNFLFSKIGMILFNLKNDKNVGIIVTYDKKDIVDAINKLYYENDERFNRSLNNIFSYLNEEEINVDILYKYIELIKILLRNPKGIHRLDS